MQNGFISVQLYEVGKENFQSKSHTMFASEVYLVLFATLSHTVSVYEIEN